MAHYKVRHLGIIPDGSGRWASERGKDLIFGYRVSVDKISDLMADFFSAFGLELSIYLFSVANFRRQDWEVEALMRVAEEFISWLSEVQAERKVNVNIAGDRHMLPSYLNAAIDLLSNDPDRSFTLNLLLAYDPLQELKQALKTRRADNDLIRSLWVKTPVDLVLRTGGAQTLSKFLPLQCAHARIIFFNRVFNDLEVVDLMSHVREHESLDLQYGE